MAYTPIDCNYYDELEALATLRRRVRIDYYGAGQQPKVIERALIVDFQTRSKEEFMLLDDGMEIRLDKLISVDGKPVPGSC